MKRPSFRPLLTATAAACLLPMAALHAQTTLQSPGGQPGESTALPAGQGMSTPMGTAMTVSPAASISQPFPPVSSVYDPDREGFQFRGIAGIERDSNVTRVSSGGTSDTITQLGLGLRFNKRYGLQRIVLDGEYDHYDFDKLSTKYSTLNYSAAWYWALGNLFDGVASADRRQFRDVSVNSAGTTINRRTERNELVEGRYKLGAAWRVLAGVQHSEARSNDPTVSWDGDPKVNSTRLGVQYESATGSTITGRYRHGSGDYQVGLAPSFKDDETELAVHYVLSPKTSLDGRIAQFKRDHDGAPARDFNGAVGGLSATWDATAKTRLVAGYAHDLASYLGGIGGHQESDRYYIQPSFRFSEQTAVNFRYEHENRKFVDVIGVATDIGRTDKFNVAAVALDWQPRRNIGVTAGYRNERRTSSLAGFNYRANVIGLAVKLSI